MEPVALGLFASRVAAVCEEMGAHLRRTAFSMNIRDRRDYSCAVFDAGGRLLAQAAAVPVHLGSMAYALRNVVEGFRWRAGDMVVFNDPACGGTHLPDVTLVAPFFRGRELLGFVANRAHHADIGAKAPGSMPLSSSIEEEGLLIAPRLIVRAGATDEETLASFVSASCDPDAEYGDYMAQIGANRIGLVRLGELVGHIGSGAWLQARDELNAYGARLARAFFAEIPDGEYAFGDVMDDDGFGATDIAIHVKLRVRSARIEVDFAGTSPQVRGNINCPVAVTASAVYYVFRCLLPDYAPTCEGVFSAITLKVPEGSLLNAATGRGVAAGNTETSMRVVDCVLGALARALPARCPAAGQGTMNSVAFGDAAAGWSYYETLGGGLGAARDYDGQSAAHSHMTNTLNTPAELLEMAYPLRVRRYAIRRGSGGAGRRRGGDGLVREYEFLAPAEVTLLTDRRRHAPWGLGGKPGAAGRNALNGRELPGKTSFVATPGDRLKIETPGGGGWGVLERE